MKNVLIATVEPPLGDPSQHGVGRLALATARAIRSAGGRAAIISPAFPGSESLRIAKEVRLNLPPDDVPCRVFQQSLTREDGLQVYSVEIDGFFPRPSLYGENGGGYTDNARRFTLFSRAVVETARRLDPSPGHLHLFDWPTAISAALVQDSHLPFKTVTQVIDPRFQGLVAAEQFASLGLPRHLIRREFGEFFGQFSLLKAGLSQSHRICALSPKHARRLIHDAAGMEGVLSSQHHRLAHLPTSLLLLAALDANIKPSAQNSGTRSIRVVAGLAPAHRINDFFDAVDLLVAAGFDITFQPDPIVSETHRIELALRRHPGQFRLANSSQPASTTGPVLFLDDSSSNPLPACAAWWSGSVVCAPASPAIEDIEAWLTQHRANRDLLAYRNGGAIALFDIAQEAARRQLLTHSDQPSREQLTRIAQVDANDLLSIY